MKQILWSLWIGLALVGTSIFWGWSVWSGVPMLCKIVAPREWGSVPIRFLHRGRLYSSVDNTCFFAKLPSCSTFSIVVTNSICEKFDHSGKRVRLCRVLGAPITWFDCSLVISDAGRWEWRIVELQEQDMPEVLPSHAIVVCISPVCVVDIVNPHCVRYEGKRVVAHCDAECSIMELPRIIMSPRVSFDTLCTSLAQAECALVSVRHVHEVVHHNRFVLGDVLCRCESGGSYARARH